MSDGRKSLYTHINKPIYIYIYRQREKEREKELFKKQYNGRRRVPREQKLRL